jgi:hypothetical protein
MTQLPPPQSASLWHPHCEREAAVALFASPKQASAMPARPTPNFFSAARRVTDWARLFVSSSNLLFIFFSFRLFVCYLVFAAKPWLASHERTAT